MNREFGMGNLVAIKMDDKRLACYVNGRVSKRGVEVRKVADDKTVATATLSVRNVDFDLKAALRSLGLAEDLILTTEDDKGNKYINVRLNVWNQSGENFAKAVMPGDSVKTVGVMTVDSYTAQDGTEKHILNMTAQNGKWEKVYFNNQNKAEDKVETQSQEPATATVDVEPVVDDDPFGPIDELDMPF